jgi:hypothetical protein
MANLTIKVEHLQRGQPRAYAPHTYESRITVSGEHSWERLTEDQMKHLVQAVVHPYTVEEEDGSADSWFSPRLVALNCVDKQQLTEDRLGPQVEIWQAKVEQPYTD